MHAGAHTERIQTSHFAASFFLLKYFYKVVRWRVFFIFCLFPSPVLVNLYQYMRL